MSRALSVKTPGRPGLSQDQEGLSVSTFFHRIIVSALVLTKPSTKMRNAYLTREDKRLMKPVIEKRRRDRINQSLEHLRTLLLEATKDESLKNPKTEKVDILTKTVEFLEMCHGSGAEDTKRTMSGFKGGFQEGLSQATIFLNSAAGISEKKRGYVVEKLYQHMEDRNLKRRIERSPHDCSRINKATPSPPQISRVPESIDIVEKCPESYSCISFLHTFPSPSSSYDVSCHRQAQCTPQKVHKATSKVSLQRTLFPPTSSNDCVPSGQVWRPWP
ncbi:transcription factor HES-7-like [Spea bombifrons]|uniref:transcription factor HES-7-like n=1 Tax=Spea bombifrons TaxID=233779 RepID=UPI00234931AF|nr:transcription factor HES-7-like [Spea bombifrons]